MSRGKAFSLLLGNSDRMRSFRAALEAAAANAGPVFIHGEAGTGKSIVARALHEVSARADAPFVPCDVANAAPGSLDWELFGPSVASVDGPPSSRGSAFSKAEGGTLFLDEVSELPATTQARLLRVLAAHNESSSPERSVRLVVSSSRDLLDASQPRLIPELRDLLASCVLSVPPLRERADDLPLLASKIVADYAAAQGREAPRISAEVSELLGRYDWPGNLRELSHTLQRAMSLYPEAPDLEWEMLRVKLPKRSGVLRISLDGTFKEAKESLLEEWESEYLREVLQRTGGNMTQAARHAGIARAHLYRLMKKHGMAR